MMNCLRHDRSLTPVPPLPQRTPLSNSLPQAGERTNEKGNLESPARGAGGSLREIHYIKGSFTGAAIRNYTAVSFLGDTCSETRNHRLSDVPL